MGLPITHTSVLRIAIPIMLSNVSEPLIGVVNTAVMGRLAEPHYIGAIAIGALIFGFLFWGFGFLRLSTSGLAAQAIGAGRNDELGRILFRSLILASAVGVGLVIAGPVLGPVCVALVGGSEAVTREALVYFNYRIWAAPAALCNFAILGWFVGQSRAGVAFFTQLFLNLTNVALSLLFVIGFGMATEGVGLAVLIAEYSAAGIGLVFVFFRLRELGAWPDIRETLHWQDFKGLIAANTDIMIRTFCLVFAFGWFISRGAQSGDVTVASNAVLLNLFELAAFLIDGFAYAAEALVGQAIGAGDRARFKSAVKITTVWAGVLALHCSLIIWFGGPWVIALMTTSPEVQSESMRFLAWAAITPLLGAMCFQFDGIYTGALATRDMRNMMLLSLVVFLAASFMLEPYFGNHGLWASLCVFFVARGLTYGWKMPHLIANSFRQTDTAQSQSVR
jgi:multidrug resistance protein, MATE family